MTKLSGVMTMRNEVDVLETWARYHAQLLDRLIVADHLSIDGSLELARELKEEGLPIDVLIVEDPAYEQSRFVTQLAHRAADDGADWVFPLDADEFLNTGGRPLASDLAEVESSKPLSIPWRTYVPTSMDDQNEANILLRSSWRLMEEAVPYKKVAIPGPLLERPQTAVATGSHDLIDSGAVMGAAPCPQWWSIAHFPVRSLEQLARKVLVGWISSLANPDRGPRTSYQWKHWYEVMVEADFEALDITEVAMDYLVDGEEGDASPGLVRDPLPHDLCSFELKAPPPSGVSPLKAVVSAAEAIAEELGRMRRSGPAAPGGD